MMRLLGLDPGLQRTGWGLIDADGNRLRFVAAGAVTTEPGADLAPRLDALYRGLQRVIADYRPDAAAVEETVVNRNAASSLKLGHARGVALLAAAHAGLAVSEYASKTVKRAVVGTGGAQKRQVAMMVRVLLPGCGEVAADAADALAVAVCDAHHRATELGLAEAMARAHARLMGGLGSPSR
jgi:crossover junction endodeoxyribonuclease RuvC